MKNSEERNMVKYNKYMRIKIVNYVKTVEERAQ